MSLVRVQLPEPKISRKHLCLRLFLNLTLQYLHIQRHTKTRHKTPLWLHNSYTGSVTYFQLIELVIHSTPKFLSTYLEYKKHIVGGNKIDYSYNGQLFTIKPANSFALQSMV